MEKGKIEEYCAMIHDKHKEALELLLTTKPGTVRIYSHLGGSVVEKLGRDWKFHPTNTLCHIYREKWKKKHNPASGIPFFHYEFYNIGGKKTFVQFHLEYWGKPPDLRKPFKDELRKTKFVKIADANLDASQVVISRQSPKIESLEDTSQMNRARDKMLDLIRHTENYIEKVSESIEYSIQ